MVGTNPYIVVALGCRSGRCTVCPVLAACVCAAAAVTCVLLRRACVRLQRLLRALCCVRARCCCDVRASVLL